MPDAKITALASIGTGSDPANDPLVIVDVSDTSMAASGTTKKVTLNNLLASGPAATLASVTVTGAATVGTTLGVTGAATFTGAVVCNGAVTLGDAVGDAVSVTGSLTSYTGQNPSAIRAAASDYAAVAFDGATASTRITSTLTGQNIGTGDFSLWARFRVPASVNAVNRGLIALTSNATSTAQAESAHLFLAANAGELAFRLYGATASDLRQATVNGFLAAYMGQVVDVVVTRTGTTLKIYINGTDTAYSESTGGTPPAWSATVTSTFCNVGMAVGVSLFTGRIYRSVVFNRALSASDVTELITVGVNPADQWGTQTAVYTSDYSVDANGWLPNSNMTVTGNIDSGADGAGVPPTNDWLRTTLTASRTLFNYRNNTLIIGKRYLITGSVFVPSGSPVTHAFFVSTAASDPQNGGIPATASPVTAGVATAISSELIARNVLFGMLGNNSSNPASWGAIASGTSLYQKDVIVTRIGAIVDLDFTVGAGYQATDRSTNNLHGTLFNGVEFTVPRRMAVVYGTTSTATSQLMLGSFSIPTNAIIEDIIVNSSGTATISIGPVTGGSTTIVNAASVVAGRQKLTIATPFSTSGNLYVTSSTTAVLQFTILYTVAA